MTSAYLISSTVKTFDSLPSADIFFILLTNFITNAITCNSFFQLDIRSTIFDKMPPSILTASILIVVFTSWSSFAMSGTRSSKFDHFHSSPTKIQDYISSFSRSLNKMELNHAMYNLLDFFWFRYISTDSHLNFPDELDSVCHKNFKSLCFIYGVSQYHLAISPIKFSN